MAYWVLLWFVKSHQFASLVVKMPYWVLLWFVYLATDIVLDFYFNNRVNNVLFKAILTFILYGVFIVYMEQVFLGMFLLDTACSILNKLVF